MSKEQYSKEEFDQKQKVADLANRDAQKMIYESNKGRGLSQSARIINQLLDLEMSAKKKMEQLKETAEDEAMELNKEYNQLVRNVEDAAQALDKFRKEKLGM